MAAKRSPILGYNHNVRYRGLIFHVQTEDSGLLSPHLFTHLFHGGVILSTRKLVYDAGSAEDAIKNLMQSQHKIVLKDLKNGSFDDKIDAYLVGTEGLLPRSTPGGKAGVDSDIPSPEDDGKRSVPEITIQRPGTEEIALDAVDMVEDQPSAPVITIEPGPAIARTATPPPLPRAATPIPVSRTQTAERRSAPSQVRNKLPSAPPPPDPSELDPPTDPDVDTGAIRAALNATVKTEMMDPDSAPEIQIKLDLDEDSGPSLSRTRSKHDTEVEMPTDLGGRAATLSDGVPGSIGGAPSGRGSDSVPPPTTSERKTGERAAGMSAAALPPARPISRPPSRQAITPPAVVSRTIPPNEEHSGAVEVYAPPPSSVDPPPGERSQRPGQYAQHKRPSGGLPVDVIKGNADRSGAAAIPSGLARPGRPPSGSMPALAQPPSRAANQSQPPAPARTTSPSPPPAQPARSPSQQHAVPRTPPPPSSPPPTGPASGRTPTPPRVSASSSNTAQNRGGTGSGGVVMTRPAVIVGAPAKTTNPPRVRKAREEEGRGFGQGLISEKSLDEVILAYLSEDADDK